MRTGDFVVQLQYAEQSVELEDENWRLCSTTVVRGVAGFVEAENWRLCSTTLVRDLWSWKLRTGDFVVQL